jgi:Helicase conserved C-terminal domain
MPDKDRRYKSFAFQTELCVTAKQPFVARPDLRRAEGDTSEWDDQVADLHYRDVFEYAVGHGVATRAICNPDRSCNEVHTTWLPTAEVERIAPSDIKGVERGMEALAELVDGADAKAKLSAIVSAYRSWIETQSAGFQDLEEGQKQTAQDLLINAQVAAQRIEAGIDALKDADVLYAFKLANRCMAQAARRREAILRQTAPDKVEPPKWHPFQLAFILMTLRGILDPACDDRELVDLLFFPTGGGKTEAYLGLAAFTLILRRLRNPGITYAGVSVLMRYTLRLLTLDQLGRAAALICALELERERDEKRLGKWPFEIGLWVGSAATPNRMGGKGYTGPGADDTARVRTRRFKTNSRTNPAPIPLETCPWCGTKFETESFRLVPNEDKPINLQVHCINDKCDFCGNRNLPILGVDEPIYRRLPAFLIATIDKFASIPFTGETGALFGLIDRYDPNGFYGPCGPGKGTPLGAHLPAPDLIIQDELHLISGPLGTIAGIYETAIDALCTRAVGEKQIRPKVIASTATVRRADLQIRAIFERSAVAVFPPPGPDRRNSFFAEVELATKSPARLYLGVAAQGKSLKVILLRTALALLSAAAVAYEREGGKANRNNPADPYMTMVGYFNSLRELGGSRRIVEDEVRTRLAQYSKRKRLEPDDNLFRDRMIKHGQDDPLELTSRVSTSDVAEAKRRLTLPFYDDKRVDVALATNMISVGLDIQRLGLMVVLGQPKTSSEYIQATSRVGRDVAKPGFVVTLLNIHKARDRSHYERFESYHASFYRAVEVTSVTPFSPRALDRALAAALVALSRHGRPAMTPPLGASEILSKRTELEAFAIQFAERARNHDATLTPQDAEHLRETVLGRARKLLDNWQEIAAYFRQTNTRLQYQRWEASGASRLLYDQLDPDLAGLTDIQRQFRANRSMRDVEPNVDLFVKNLNDWPQTPSTGVVSRKHG